MYVREYKKKKNNKFIYKNGAFRILTLSKILNLPWMKNDGSYCDRGNKKKKKLKKKYT